MASAETEELVDRFDEFYRTYYEEDIADLAQRYPNEQRSLFVEWTDLRRFDEDLAEDVRSQPDQLLTYAEEALRLFDLPYDISLGQAHVRVQGLPDTTDIRDIRAEHVNRLESVRGIVRKATGVRPKVRVAAFECQRCGTLTRIPQGGGTFQEPHECQGCERQGPFRINFDQSEFIDAQKLRIQESPEGLRGGETPENIDVNIEDDIAGQVSPGDTVRCTGILRMEQEQSGGEPSALFDVYMEGISVEPEEEQFDEMDITEEDERRIVELSDEPDIYSQMVDSIAPSIYGHENAKLAMVLQLFSGVTKNLPDGSRTRGDTHMLLIGDPGTGKCLSGDTLIHLSDGTAKPIEAIVEAELEDPSPVDDGVFDEASLSVPSVTEEGTIEHRAVTRVWKRESPSTLYRITTESGRAITTTSTHPLFVQDDGGLVAHTAEELHEGDFLATYQDPKPQHAVAQTDGGVPSEVRQVPTEGTHRGSEIRHPQGRVASDIGWDRIESIERIEPEDEWVYDLEVEGTHNYIAEGLVSHNSALLQYVRNIAPRSVYTSGKGSSAAGLTAAAVRDDFGDGQQWSLEAGALVLADQGIAAVDELDKMDPGDRSAMHEGLEAQEISISKAGINATLKARCSLLGAANPQYGRFDPYEPMGEQIDLEPALISRFDLIFTMTDQPDEEQDRNLAEHILETNYAGELSTQLEKLSAPEVSQQELQAASGTVTPAIDPDLFRKYVAFAQQSCYPRMTDEARQAIQEFYVDLRSRGADEDAPVPVTARKLEALVRLSEASARVRLSDTVGLDDAERVIELVRSCLQDIGVDPETGQYDADVIETGRSKTQRDRVRNLKEIIRELQSEHDDGAPIDEVLAKANEIGIERAKAEDQIQRLKDSGEIFAPSSDFLRLVN